MADLIVVGVDGSDNGWHALEWAVGEAKLRSATLRVVTSFEDPVAGVGLGTAFTTGVPIAFDPDVMAAAAKDVCEQSRSRVGDVPVELISRTERPGDALVELSEGAVMLVVGSRGHSAVGSLLLGSVSNYVVHHATCPVVVVPKAA